MGIDSVQWQTYFWFCSRLQPGDKEICETLKEKRNIHTYPTMLQCMSANVESYVTWMQQLRSCESSRGLQKHAVKRCSELHFRLPWCLAPRTLRKDPCRRFRLLSVIEPCSFNAKNPCLCWKKIHDISWISVKMCLWNPFSNPYFDDFRRLL